MTDRTAKKYKAEIEKLQSELERADEVIGFREAEIERLKAVVADTEKSFNKMTELYNKAFKRYKTAKSEAYKEFAERWKIDLAKYRDMLVIETINMRSAFEIAIATTNDLLKELTEGETKP